VKESLKALEHLVLCAVTTNRQNVNQLLQLQDHLL